MLDSIGMGVTRTWSKTDVGVLKDVGYLILPEPGTADLLLGGLLVLALIWRVRLRRERIQFHA
jgi:hypothetical protein